MTDVQVIGDECFASSDGEVISWRGRNFVPQETVLPLRREGNYVVASEEDFDDVADVSPRLARAFAAVDTQWRELGVDPADFDVYVTYGVFNDPQVWEPKFASGQLPETLREPLLDTPLYEDDQASRTLAHARLMNDDRRRLGRLDSEGMVLVKRRVTLRSKWLLDVVD